MIDEGSIPFLFSCQLRSISCIFNKYELLIADYLSSTGYSERESAKLSARHLSSRGRRCRRDKWFSIYSATVM